MFWLLSYISITSCLATILVFLITKWYWDRYYWTKKLPPGPPSLPVLGSLPFMTGEDTAEGLTKLAKKYGDIFMLDLGPQKCLVLNRHDVVREALVKYGDLMLDKPNKYLGMYPHGDNGLALGKGEEWYELRKFVQHCFRDFGFGKRTMEEVILEEMDAILNEMASHDGRPFDPSILFCNSALNVVASVIYGRRFDYKDPNFLRVSKFVENWSVLLEKNTLYNCYPILRQTPFVPKSILQLDDTLIEFSKLAQSWIEEKKQIFSAENEPSSLIEAYLLKFRDVSQSGMKCKEDHLKWTMVDLMFGGTDTTSMTLAWSVVYMMNYPDVKEKVQAEIRNVIGLDRKPTLQDRLMLPYCDAVLNEILRLCVSVPIPIPRITKEDFILRGYHIPGGTTVIPNMRSVLHYPLDWEDPEAFRPEHFLYENGKFRRRPEMIQFSVGKRNCVGEGVARNELFLFFVGMNQKYNFKPPEGQSIPRTEDLIPGLITRPKPYKVIATEIHEVR